MIFTTHLWIPRMVEAPTTRRSQPHWSHEIPKDPRPIWVESTRKRRWLSLWPGANLVLLVVGQKGPERWSVRDLFGSKATSSRQTFGFCWSDGGPFLSCWCRFNISQWSAELVHPKACTSWPGRPVKRPMRGAWQWQHWARGALKLLGGRVLNIAFRWLHPVNSIYIVDHERTWPDHES